MDPSLKTIKARARIRLLPSSESGRTAPIRGSYRPNHNFFEDNTTGMTVGAIDLPDGIELHLGEAMDVTIEFWHWPLLDAEIYAGRQWRIQEGHRVVGIGEILDVLP
jgi:translation elongation factor EF-Tu-like GTPase